PSPTPRHRRQSSPPAPGARAGVHRFPCRLRCPRCHRLQWLGDGRALPLRNHSRRRRKARLGLPEPHPRRKPGMRRAPVTHHRPPSNVRSQLSPSSLRRFVASSLRRFVASSLRRFVASSLRRFVALSNPCSPSSIPTLPAHTHPFFCLFPQV